MRFLLHPAARRELHRAVEWYAREAGKSVAAELVAELVHLQALIERQPLIGTRHPAGFRKLVFRRFPFSLVYRQRGEAIEVLAVAHHSRLPDYWANRR